MVHSLQHLSGLESPVCMHTVCLFHSFLRLNFPIQFNSAHLTLLAFSTLTEFTREREEKHDHPIIYLPYYFAFLLMSSLVAAEAIKTTTPVPGSSDSSNSTTVTMLINVFSQNKIRVNLICQHKWMPILLHFITSSTYSKSKTNQNLPHRFLNSSFRSLTIKLPTFGIHKMSLLNFCVLSIELFPS